VEAHSSLEKLVLMAELWAKEILAKLERLYSKMMSSNQLTQLEKSSDLQQK